MTTKSKQADYGLYGAKRSGTSHLLGGVASVLTGGRVKRVDMDSKADTGACQFDGKDGKTVRRIVLPTPDRMPEGFGEDAMRGLLDHESAHAIWSDFVGFKPKNQLEMTVTNIIEDARIEELMRRRFIGCKDNIDAMNQTMCGKIDHKGFNEADAIRQILTTFSIGMVMGEAALEDEIYAWAECAEDLRTVMGVILPIGKAALKAADSKGVYLAALDVIRAIATMKDPEPKPESPKGARGPKAPAAGGEDAGEGADPAEGEEDGASKPSKAKGKASPEAGEDEAESQSAASGDQGEDEGEDGEDADQGEDHPGDLAGELGEAMGDDAIRAATKGEEPGEGAGSGSKKAPGAGEPKGEAETEGSGPKVEPGNGGDDGQAPEKSRTRLFVKEARENAAEGKGPEGTDPVALADMVYEAVKEAIEETIKEEDAARREIEARLLRTGLYKPTFPWEGKDHEIKAPKVPEGDYRKALDRVRPIVNGLRTMLRLRILAEGKTRLRHGKEDGPIVSAKTISALAAGTSDRVFASFSRGKSRKTAISLLIDGSGSMNGYPVETATYAALALAEALRGLPGVSVEVNGFEWRGQSVRYCLKPFASRDNSGIVNFLAHSGSGNDDGLAVRWAARRLLAEKAERRILIVLSDGWPADPWTGGGVTVNDDLKSAVGACERAGIETIGIGIVSEAVQAFYPRNVVVKKVEDLTGTVLKELGRLFDPASALFGKREAKKIVA